MDNDIKIKIILKDKGKLLANANIYLPTLEYGIVVIKGFQVWKSERENTRLHNDMLNIQPPSTWGKYKGNITFVFFEDEPKWYKIESLIYDKYIESMNKQNVKEFDLDEIDIGIEKSKTLFTN